MNYTKLSGFAVILSFVLISGCTVVDFLSSTSSTLDAVTPDVTLNRFVDVRIASIRKEAATGEGENLTALGQLMGRHDTVKFSNWMRVHYDELFTELNQPSELISRINKITVENKG